MSPNLNPEREPIQQAGVSPIERRAYPSQEQFEESHESHETKKEAEGDSRKEAHGESAFARVTAPTTQSQQRSAVPAYTDEVQRIEKILEEHIGELYATLPEEKKEPFRVKGEETARSIQLVLQKTKVKLREIISLIVSWLSFIPGVNKYFIEQQAEIKANKILKQHEQQH